MERYEALEGLSNDQLATWAAQVLSQQRSTFSERVEARAALRMLVERADAYQGAVEALRDIRRFVDDRNASQGTVRQAIRTRINQALDHPGGR